MFRGKWKILLGIIVLVMIVIAVYVFYLYQQGGTESYNPPVQKTDDLKVQIMNDMTILSGAVEAYYAKNLKYPDKLEQLKPEFIDKIPLETGTEKSFIYVSDGASEGRDRYRITVSDPSRYGFKELFIENGKIIQK
jgi:hypothetical protein